MSRTRHILPLNPVSSYEVAPHRYLWTGTDDSYRYADNYREFMAGVPYKAGEVAWFDYCGETRKVYIVAIYVDRDEYGSYREKYLVRMANKKGDQFAKNWFYTWPGFIQRGYKLAGLAPEMPESK